ncbi:MAG: IS1380 family transposase, partial [Balneolaceae bacterium]|nr:IS1380 family transposase [Balneolaceae bacterium]
MHITKSSDKITPFGGLDFCLESFHQSGLTGLIDHRLGPRGQSAGFSYSDIVANLMSVLFTGGDCAEDLAEHLREPLRRTRGLSVCSPDTLLRGVK